MTPPSGLDDEDLSDGEDRGLGDSGTLLDKSSATRREVLDTLRWRLEAEKSVKIGEELQFLVLEQQHELSQLRAQLHDSQQQALDVTTSGTTASGQNDAELVQLRKDLRQAKRDNEALSRRTVAEEERADNLQRSVQAVDQEKRIVEQVVHVCTCALAMRATGGGWAPVGTDQRPAESARDSKGSQERRALSAKVDELLRQVTDIKSERDSAEVKLKQSMSDANELEVCSCPAAAAHVLSSTRR